MSQTNQSEPFPRLYGPKASSSSLEKFPNDIIPKLFSNYCFYDREDVCLPQKEIKPKRDKERRTRKASGCGQAPVLFLKPQDLPGSKVVILLCDLPEYPDNKSSLLLKLLCIRFL